MSDKEIDAAARLRVLMEAHKLSRAAVANLLGVSPFTVGNWLASPTAHRYRQFSAPMCRLLELELKLCPKDLESALAVETLSLNDFFANAIRKA